MELILSLNMCTCHHKNWHLLQFAKLTPPKLGIHDNKFEEDKDVTEKDVLASLKRAIGRISTLQAHDGHWPGDIAGPMFLLPGLVGTSAHVHQ
jgi:cycloartenol synthase